MAYSLTGMIGSAAQSEPRLALAARDLVFAYDRQNAVDHVSLGLETGELLGLAGPNGAGKSTLLNLLSGFLAPLSGEVMLFGRPLAALTRREIAARIAFVPQKTESAFSFTVTEMVVMGRQPYAGLGAFDTAEDMRVAQEAMEQAEIGNLAGKFFNNLSGGEQQLVLLARALAQRAPILILDEPTSFLDLRHQWQMMNLMKMHTRGGRLVAATFHDLNLAARWCDRIALMHNGALVACGKPAEVLNARRLESVYGIPLRVDALPGGNIRVEFPE
ncbi:MAG: ABC transporter ATP-binding protein [bacterium]|nr:ABC transporter ATP-binding protein [Candidatus Sumerlaeota bacterium]